MKVLTKPQREVFDKVKDYVLGSRSGARKGMLTMANTFPAREREFIKRLAEDLHLDLRWDGFDENDNNVLTWRFPGLSEDASIEENLKESAASATLVGEVVDCPQDSEWEDVSDEDEDNEESRVVIDRVLQKYEEAPIFDEEVDGGFEARHQRLINQKMDQWKRGYYEVRWSSK